MRIYIEKIKSITLAVMMVLSLGLISSCQKDSLQDEASGLAPDECMIRLTVPESLDQEIATRSEAVFEENYVEDLYVLCFDDLGVFTKGQVLEIKDIVNAATTKTTKVITGTKGKVVFIANSTKFTGADVAAKTANLNTEMAGKTVDSINVVLSDSWNLFKLSGMDTTFGKYIPMSGIYEYSSRPPTEIDVALIRSFAKVQLSYAIPAGDDVTGLFIGTKNADQHTFTIRNFLKKGLNNIYRDLGLPISNPTEQLSDPTDLLNAFETKSAEAYIKENMWSSTPQRMLYLPEYPNQDFAKGKLVDSALWNKDRMCIIIKATDRDKIKTQYFRLDFCQKTVDGTYKFLDIERNKHITFKVTAVKSEGYATEEEALAAPSSNIEYTVDVSEQNQVVNTNGQYAICMTNDGTIIKGGKGTYDVATVSYQAPEGIDLSSLEAKSSVTTNMPSGVTNAKLLFNGVQITQGMATPPKFVSSSNIIQLVTEDNTGEVDCQVYLSFGNIKDTVVVKRYPYDDKKLELKLAGTDVPNMIWEKNEAKVTASKTMLTVPYRVQRNDAPTQGTIAGKFRLGTASAAPAANAPVTTHLKVDVLQKGIDGILNTFYTNQNNGQLQFGSVVETGVSSTNGVEKVLLPGNNVEVSALSYIYGGMYYKASGWERPDGSTAPITPSGDAGYILTVPYALNNAGDYTALFENPISAQVSLTFDKNGISATNMPISISGNIGENVTIPSTVPTEVAGDYNFVKWNTNPTGTGADYVPGNKFQLKVTDNKLYAIWAKKVKITYINSRGQTSVEKYPVGAIYHIDTPQFNFLYDGNPSHGRLNDATFYAGWSDGYREYFINAYNLTASSDKTYRAVAIPTRTLTVHERSDYWSVDLLFNIYAPSGRKLCSYYFQTRNNGNSYADVLVPQQYGLSFDCTLSFNSWNGWHDQPTIEFWDGGNYITKRNFGWIADIRGSTIFFTPPSNTTKFDFYGQW